MSKLLFMAVIVTASFITNKTYGQDFSYYRTNENGQYETNLTFKNIPSREIADLMISSTNEIDGAIELELFFPDSNKAILRMNKLIDVKVLIAKMKDLGIELTNESINFDTK